MFPLSPEGVFDKDTDPWFPVPVNPENERILGQGNLHLDYVLPSDAGPYVCTASSTNPRTGKVISISQVRLGCRNFL